MVKEVGEEVASRVEMFNGDCHDQASHPFWHHFLRHPGGLPQPGGQCDKIVCTGSVLPHYLAGYAGGERPAAGVAWYETIRKNHSMIFHPDSTALKLKGNPYTKIRSRPWRCAAHLFAQHGAHEKMQTVRVFAGDYIQAHMEACKFVDEIYVADIETEADLVIISSGGYPKDIDIYQLIKP